MKKEYRELFDEVHASQRLRTEVMNMKHEEIKPTHRIPRAALIAAVLLIVLAGTAVAVEYFGWIKIEPINGWTGSNGSVDGSGYALTYEDDGRFPAESLSEEVFAIGEEIGDVHLPHRTITFDSWTACEEFLGVELANNPRLKQMRKDAMRLEDRDGNTNRTYAYVSLSYSKQMPSYISASACYKEGDVNVSQSAQILTQYAFYDPEVSDIVVPQNGEEPLRKETYITSDGTEAFIFIDTYDTPISTYTSCYAFFIRNNVRFTLNVSVKTHDRQEPTNAPDALATTKEILDAYE